MESPAIFVVTMGFIYLSFFIQIFFSILIFYFSLVRNFIRPWNISRSLINILIFKNQGKVQSFRHWCISHLLFYSQCLIVICQRSFAPTIPSHLILKRPESFYQKRKGRQAGRISLIKGNSQKNKKNSSNLLSVILMRTS